MEPDGQPFEYLDLVVVGSESGQGDICMVEDHFYTHSGIEYTISPKIGEKRRVRADELKKVGVVSYPIAFGTAVVATDEFVAKTKASLSSPHVIGMSYDYQRDVWWYLLPMDDGTTIVAQRSDFEVVRPDFQ